MGCVKDIDKTDFLERVILKKNERDGRKGKRWEKRWRERIWDRIGWYIGKEEGIE